MDRRNGRRRRVLRDESRQDGEHPVDENASGNIAGYNESALVQPSLTDLIPVQPLRVIMTILGGAVMLLGLLVLDDWAASREISSFQLGRPGSLASWFASTLLMWSAGGAVLTYLIRRHRTDDYRGVYHIWLWAAGFLVAASIAATSAWHHQWNRALQALTGVDLGPHGWWLATVGAAALLLLLRITVEVRACRAAVAMFVLAIAGYTTVCLVQTGVVLQEQQPLADLANHFGVLTSHLILAYGIWWNARYVQLDAQGIHAEKAARRLAAREAKAEKRRQRHEQREASRQQRSDKSQEPAADQDDAEEEQERDNKSSQRKSKKAKPPRASTRPQKRASEEEEQDEAPDTISLEEERKLSKAERRRERKKKRRMAA